MHFLRQRDAFSARAAHANANTHDVKVRRAAIFATLPRDICHRRDVALHPPHSFHHVHSFPLEDFQDGYIGSYVSQLTVCLRWKKCRGRALTIS